MSLDGNMIRRLTKEFNQVLVTGRINKIYQISKYDFLFAINGKLGKQQLLISCSPNYARTYITELKIERPETPPMFCMFLRKHLDGGIIKEIYQIENDRIIVFEIEKRNELGDLSTKKMILEIMGRHSNFIITDNENKILEALKHQMPFDGTDRTLFPGAIYRFPETNQINPYDVQLRNEFLSNPDNIDYNRVRKSFMGFSPLFTKEIFYLFENSQNDIKTIISNLLSNNEPVLITNDKDHFYFTDLKHIEGDRRYFDTISKLLDRYFYNRDSIDIIKQKSKDIIKFTNNSISRLRNKIEKLSRNLRNTDKREKFKVQGELIQANIFKIKKGDHELKCVNYYSDQEITILLDEKLTPIQNSEKYFKKYKKIKASIPHLETQIKEAKLELMYFEQILHQIENASLKDIEEIKDELMNKKFIKRSQKNKKRKFKPNFDTYFDVEGNEILVGKNNTQNEYITHKLARHNEVWFHAKEAPGSHVVIRKTLPLSENSIRTCAQLAAYFSKMRGSSSVPVDYVEVRYIKKVPGRINSFVTYKNHKTIYIDPQQDFILQLQKK